MALIGGGRVIQIMCDRFGNEAREMYELVIFYSFE